MTDADSNGRLLTPARQPEDIDAALRPKSLNAPARLALRKTEK